MAEKHIWGEGTSTPEKITNKKLNDNVEYLEELALSSGDTQFNQDTDTTSGLDFGYSGGVVRDDNIIHNIAADTITLADNATNYIEVDDSGISSNTTGFSSGKIPLYIIDTEDGEIVGIENKRTWLDVGENGSGLVLGETSSTAYRGDRGKTAYDHSQLTSGNPHNVTKTDVGLSNVTNDKQLTKVEDDITPKLGGNLDANSKKITGLATPTDDGDAATKKYVDDNAGDGVELPPPSSSVIYVDNGRDDVYTPDGSVNKPYKTIQDALDDFNDTVTNTPLKNRCSIIIAPGWYTGAEVDIDTLSEPIRLSMVGMAGGGSSSINIEGLKINIPSGSDGILVSLKSLTFVFEEGDAGIEVVDNNNYTGTFNLYLHQCHTAGVDNGTGNGIVFERKGTGFRGLYLSPNNIIRGGSDENSQGEGMILDCDEVVIQGSDIYGYNAPAIRAVNDTEVRIWDTTITSIKRGDNYANSEAIYADDEVNINLLNCNILPYGNKSIIHEGTFNSSTGNGYLAIRGTVIVGGADIDLLQGALLLSGQFSDEQGAKVTANVAVPQLRIYSESSSNIGYTPTTGGDWDNSPVTVTEALEELAGRESDGGQSGAEITSGHLIAGWRLVGIDSSGKIIYADATTLQAAVGYVQTQVANNTSGTVLFNGIVEGQSGLTTGDDVFLDEDGKITQSVPQSGLLQKVGVAISATKYLFIREQGIELE